MKGDIIQAPTCNLYYTVKAKNITYSVACQAGSSGKEKIFYLEKKIYHEDPQLRSTYKIMPISTIPFSLN